MAVTKVTTKKRRDWRVPFIKALSKSPSVTHAANIAGVSRKTVYLEYKINPDFAELWDDAIESSIELAEHEAFRRGVEGVDKPVMIGKQREIVKEYSDTLLIFLLKTHKPEVYRDISTQNVNVKIGKLNDAELKQYIEQRLARVGLGTGRSGETQDSDQSAVIIDNANTSTEAEAKNDG